MAVSEGTLPMTPLRTGFFLHEAAPLHDTGWGHPEHQGRLPALAGTIGKDLLALHGRVEHFEGRTALHEELLRVHPNSYLDHVEAACAAAGRDGGRVLVGEETPVSAASLEAIYGSAGTALDAGERVCDGLLRNAFVATRPPGHHASAVRAMGFCVVNHVAVLARHLQATGRAERVAIVDWDVHHGNGTQDIFWSDPTVFFLSLHQWPHYPGTGAAWETGAGAGSGATLNVPVSAGTAGEGYRSLFDGALARVEANFQPDAILISSGFDALAGDPLGGLLLEPEDFAEMARRVQAWADRVCDGRVVTLLEGGYDPPRTALAAGALLRALAGVPT